MSRLVMFSQHIGYANLQGRIDTAELFVFYR